MNRIKVATVVGTRPEIIRLSRTICALENSDSIDHYLIHTGQNYDYELNEIFFKDLSLKKPHYFLNSASDNFAETLGNTLINIDKV